MEEFKLVVFHSGSSYRKRMSDAALLELPSDQVYSFSGQRFFQREQWERSFNDTDQIALKGIEFDLVVAHAGDRKKAKKLHAKRLVFFGGHGESGDERAKNADYIYQDVYGRLSSGEPLGIFRPLKEWCLGGDRPRFLDPPRPAPEFVIALSILCQGFLAAFALRNASDAGGVDTRGNPEIARALFKMGWVTDENAEKICDEVTLLGLESADGNPDIGFWKEPFEDGDKSLRDGVQSELPKNQENLPAHVETLVAAIEKQQVPDVEDVADVEAVAKAFRQLSELLEKVPADGSRDEQ